MDIPNDLNLERKTVERCNAEMPMDIPLRFRPETSKCVLENGHYETSHMTALTGNNWNIVFYWRC